VSRQAAALLIVAAVVLGALAALDAVQDGSVQEAPDRGGAEAQGQ